MSILVDYIYFRFGKVRCRLASLNKKSPFWPTITYASLFIDNICIIVSLHIRSMWETICDSQASFWLNSKFLSNFPESPFLEFQIRKHPPSPISENFRFEVTKVYSGIPPLLENFRFEVTNVYSGIPPHFGKLQIWDDQSLLQNTPPPFWKTSDLRWPKFTPEYPPPFRKTSDLRWPKFTPEYTPYFGKLQIWGDQCLLWNTPLPISENFRFKMAKVYSGIPPLFGKCRRSYVETNL